MALRWSGIAVGWLVALLWATRASAWLRGISRLPDLMEQQLPAARGSLSVIVPARNEGPGVAAGLRSLLASKGGDLEVIAVDDRSTDETGMAMDALEQEAPAARVRYVVEHVRELPAGWLGKPYAMACGTALATGEWLLFTDAAGGFAEGTLGARTTWWWFRR